MSINITNELLNVGKLQHVMNQTVFDYVDTTQKSAKAYEILDDLLHQAVNYFNSQLEKNNGDVPKRSAYWPLFMDVAAKLIYFNGLTHAQLIDSNDNGARLHIVEMYKTAARCLPNVTTEENAEFLAEISKSAELLVGEAIRLETSATLEQCLAQFQQLAHTYK